MEKKMKITKIEKQNYLVEINNKKYRIEKIWIFWNIIHFESNLNINSHLVSYKLAKEKVQKIAFDNEKEKKLIETAKSIGYPYK
jgi:hypothetical protein